MKNIKAKQNVNKYKRNGLVELGCRGGGGGGGETIYVPIST